MARNLLSPLPPEEAVLVVWPLVCGKEVATRTRAAAFAEGVLTVEVADTTWRTQLLNFASRYVAVFQELLGPVVKEVEFVAKQSALSSQRSAKPDR